MTPPLSAESGSRLFVYGTLLADANHAMGSLLRRHASRIGTGSIPGRLYIVPDPMDSTNSYPGAMPSGDPSERVHGEVYAISGDANRLLATLDEFEHCSPDRPEPHEFMRRTASVDMSDGTILKATVYLYTWDVSRARFIPGGRFEGDGSQVR